MTTSRIADWKRFRLRSLLLMLTVCCLLLGLLFSYIEPYRQQARSLATLIRLEGAVATRPAEGPAWQRWMVTKLLGPDAFVEVTSVNLTAIVSDEDVMQSLAGLAYLRELGLERARFTEEGAAALSSLGQLDTLSLRFANISDRESERLGTLSGLKTLYLTSTDVSDASIPELAKLQELDELYIRWTRISEPGAQRLREALPFCTVYYYPHVRDPAEELSYGSR